MRRVEDLVREQRVNGHELFVFTDNLVFESTFYKGHSASRKLSDIILRLRRAERDASLVLHVIHVAGTRMKHWGIDGLSRGDFQEGLLGGNDPLEYIPLRHGADARARGRVGNWVRSWWRVGRNQREPWGGLDLVEIDRDNMFELYQVEGPRLWMPPPAAMETVMELFNEDRIAHPGNAHVFAVPRLMTHLWRKTLSKDADLMFTVATGDRHFWETSQHEPLIVAIVLPLSYCENYRGPWVARGTPESLRAQHELEAGFKLGTKRDSGESHVVEGVLREVWSDQTRRSGFVLQQFLAWAGRFPPVQNSLLRGVLRSTGGRSLPQATGGGARRRRPRRRNGRGVRGGR